MKITFQSPARRDVWIVRATGYSGDADAHNLEDIYIGSDQNIAKRTYLALSHADLHSLPRPGHYASALAPVFAQTGEEGDAPFAWASKSWSYDVTSDVSSGHGWDATLKGAKMAYVDEHGAERDAEVNLSPEEKSLLAGLSKKFSVAAMMAMFESLDLKEAIPAASFSKPPLGL
jgi:hypothetical protein